MTSAVLADTGPLYAAADIHDAHHHRARRELTDLARSGREVIVLYPILLECYTLVSRRLGLAAASLWLSEIVAGAALLNPTPEDYGHAVVLVRAFGDQPITLFDAVVVVLARRLRLDAWTYDHHFRVLRASVWQA